MVRAILANRGNCMNLRKRVVAALAVGASAILVLATPAAAATTVTRYTLSTTGARGITDVGWESATRADPVNMRVYDTVCDGKASYVYFTVYPYGASSWATPKRWDKNGCNTDVSYNSYINDARTILKIVFHVCRDGGSCASTTINNPKSPY